MEANNVQLYTVTVRDIDGCRGQWVFTSAEAAALKYKEIATDTEENYFDSVTLMGPYHSGDNLFGTQTNVILRHDFELFRHATGVYGVEAQGEAP